MVLLLEKYPGGYEEWAKARGEEPNPSPLDKPATEVSKNAEPQNLKVAVPVKSASSINFVEIVS